MGHSNRKSLFTKESIEDPAKCKIVFYYKDIGHTGGKIKKKAGIFSSFPLLIKVMMKVGLSNYFTILIKLHDLGFGTILQVNFILFSSIHFVSCVDQPTAIVLHFKSLLHRSRQLFRLNLSLFFLLRSLFS